jgi:hypothetical protein
VTFKECMDGKNQATTRSTTGLCIMALAVGQQIFEACLFDPPVKKLKNGLSDVDYSKKSVQCLRESQKKKITINSTMTRLMRDLDKLEYEDAIKLDVYPFVPLSVILREDEKYSEEKSEVFSHKEIIQISEIKKHNNKSWNNFLDSLYVKMGITEELLK